MKVKYNQSIMTHKKIPTTTSLAHKNPLTLSTGTNPSKQILFSANKNKNIFMNRSNLVLSTSLKNPKDMLNKKIKQIISSKMAIKKEMVEHEKAKEKLIEKQKELEKEKELKKKGKFDQPKDKLVTTKQIQKKITLTNSKKSSSVSPECRVASKPEKSQSGPKEIKKGNQVKTLSPYSKIQPSSYCNTVSSTNNTENNLNYNLVDFSKFQSTVDLIVAKQKTKCEFLQNNIFLNKLVAYIQSMLSPQYNLKVIVNNEQAKKCFAKLEQKIAFINNANTNNVNIINADMLNSEIGNDSTTLISNNRKEIYKTFFNFYYEMCDDISDLINQLPTVTRRQSETPSLKKIDEVNSKMSSLHSKINFSKTESLFLGNVDNYNTNLGWNDNTINKNMMMSNLNREGQKIDDESFLNMPSFLISSINSDFYQNLLEEDTQQKETIVDTLNIKPEGEEKKSKSSESKSSSSSSEIIENEDDLSSETERSEVVNIPKNNTNRIMSIRAINSNKNMATLNNLKYESSVKPSANQSNENAPKFRPVIKNKEENNCVIY